MTDLHSKIMDIQVDTQKVDRAIDECCRESCFKDYSKVVRIASRAYRRGHRDARHAAAELAVGNQIKWIDVKDRLPDHNERVLTISPVYDQPENRYRLMDGQFVRICKDVTKWISVKELEESL